MRRDAIPKVVRGLAVTAAVLLVLGAGAAWYWGFYEKGLNRDVDPAVVAESETAMWQAYYAHDNKALGWHLVRLLREQFGLSLRTSLRVGGELARAAMVFAQSQGDYESAALDHLVRAYTMAHDAVGGAWDPEQVAQAELRWWVDRRTPGRNNEQTVGASIAHLYALIYGDTNHHIDRAGLLRARASLLRDRHASNPDWDQIRGLLENSYAALREGIAAGPGP